MGRDSSSELAPNSEVGAAFKRAAKDAADRRNARIKRQRAAKIARSKLVAGSGMTPDELLLQQRCLRSDFYRRQTEQESP